MHWFPRVTQLVLLPFSLLAVAVPAAAQQLPVPQAPQTADDPWLYKGSDLYQDPNWKFGRLANGLRYAVRRNGVPPGQVAVRVRIDAGSLMEQDSERGFAHLLEHLSFRGSAYVPDGESKRIWQRFGVTFGSDSNASTTFTQTVYKLDLPSATPTSLDESFKILSGMMSAPTITDQSLNAERPVVLAEQREQPGPQVRLQDKMLELAFQGQKLAQRKPIGTVETLTGATAASVRAFHERWYRPERATVIVVGDVDPSILEAMVVKHFSAWQGKGPAPESPDFGKPQATAVAGASLVEPAIQPMAMMMVLRPWTVFSDTVIFNQERMVDLVSTRIMNRRLETRARAGASFLGAGVSLDDIARSANTTMVTVVPIGSDWQAALRDVRSIIADVQTVPASQAEIDRELAEIENSMKNRVATEPVESGVSQADDLVQAVDINETVTTAEASYGIFKDAVNKKMFTPDKVLAAAKRIFEGNATRAIVNLHAADPQAVTKVTAALQAPVTGTAAARREVGNITFDRLPRLGAPGKLASRETVLPDPKIEKIVFENGVTLLIHETRSEVSRVYVNVRFGGGLNVLPADARAPTWAGSVALVASGIGDLGQEELDALTGNRQMGFEFAVTDDAFVFAGQTNKADLPDQLKLFAAKLAKPGWDPNPITRAKAGMLAGYAGIGASPDGVLGRDLERLLHSGDPRWGMPSRETIAALTPQAFRKLWEPILASGPIEVAIFGDHDTEASIRAVADTFGALPARKAPAKATPVPAFPKHAAKPVVRTHTGQPDQAAAVIAWPTGGGTANNGIAESRRLEVLAAVFRDRLIDRLRSQAGVSYSPNLVSDWPMGMTSGGKIAALGLIPPDKTGFFFDLAREIAADLVAKPIDQDELDRALKPLIETLLRRSTGNMFWLGLVDGGSFDPARIASAMPGALRDDYRNVTPADVQALAVKYLKPEKDWTMAVLPEAKKGAVAR